MQNIENQVLSWQKSVFPNATMSAKLKKLREECIELFSAIESGDMQNILEEVADVFIVAVSVANDRKHFEDNVSMSRVITDKLAVNKGRSWGPEDAEGNRVKK